MSDRILLGETRSDAISRVQESLGPATSRPLAEKTFWALARKGHITMDPTTGAYLIEDTEGSEIKSTADGIVQGESKRQGVSYNVNRNHFHRARVAWQWKSRQASIFAPSLEGAGVDLSGGSDNTPDDQDDSE